MARARSVKLPADLDKWLVSFADETGSPVNQVLIRAIREFRDHYEGRPHVASQAIVPYDLGKPRGSADCRHPATMRVKGSRICGLCGKEAK